MAEKPEKKRSVPAIVSLSLVVSVLLIEANIIVYSAIISLLRVRGHAVHVFLGLGLFALSGGFIAMLIIEKYSARSITRALYLITAAWTGMFAYLLTAAILYDVARVFMQNARPFGFGIFAAAVAVSLYGILHGMNIKIKKVTVTIPNLPKAWRGRTAVWISDLHLGSVRGPRFAGKITRLSNSLSPDIVFIGGDLYDGTHAPDPLLIARPLEKLSSRFGTVYITGNHEEFESPTLFLAAVRALGMRILNDEVMSIDGLEIAGVDYHNSAKADGFRAVLEKLRINRARPTLLLKHEPKDLEIAEQAGIALQISGHTHNGQQWPFNLLAQMAYKGYAYGLKPYGSMQVFVSSGAGGWGPPLRVGSDCEIVQITFI